MLYSDGIRYTSKFFKLPKLVEVYYNYMPNINPVNGKAKLLLVMKQYLVS